MSDDIELGDLPDLLTEAAVLTGSERLLVIDAQKVVGYCSVDVLRAVAFSTPWSGITGKPTTLGGYGITDALSTSPSSTQRGSFGDVALGGASRLIISASGLTANRTLVVSVGDANRTLTLGGNLTVTANTSLSGTNTGDQTITLSGDATGSGSGPITVAITAGAVTNAKLADVSSGTIKGRSSSGTGAPEDLSPAQVRTMLGVGDTYTHPASGVTAGTYKSVTVNTLGHVAAGTNPTTLDGYGITDALAVAGGTMSGPLLLADDPVAEFGAATKQYVDSRDLDSLGGVGLLDEDGEAIADDDGEAMGGPLWDALRTDAGLMARLMEPQPTSPWTTTGTAVSRTLDSDTATLADVRSCLGAVILDLQARGVLT